MNSPRDPGSIRAFKAMIALEWLALPAIGIMYGLAWNQMPEPLATHFGLNQQPNGWMSRQASLTFSLAKKDVVKQAETSSR